MSYIMEIGAQPEMMEVVKHNKLPIQPTMWYS